MARLNALTLGVMLLFGSAHGLADDLQWQQYERQFRQRNWTGAQQTLQAMAASGDAQAAMTLAQWFRNGTGGSKNLEKARRWMRQAAEQGMADAQYHLGIMYVKGIGGEVSSSDAIHWLTMARQQGHAPAADMLADVSWQQHTSRSASKATPVIEKKESRSPKEARPLESPLQRKLAAVQGASQQVEAFRRAVLKDDRAVLAALLERLDAGAEAQVFAPDADGQTLVTLAAGAASVQTLALLMKRAPAHAWEDLTGRNALFHAVKGHRADNVDHLLMAGVDPLMADQKGITPVMWALSLKSDLGVRLLAHVAPSRRDPAWLVMATKQGDQRFVTLLLGEGMAPDFQDAQGRSALWYAAQNHAQLLVEALLKAGASPLLADKMGDTPLHMASRSGSSGLIEALLSHAGNVASWNRGNASGAAPLHIACESGNLAAAKVLLKQGAVVDGRDSVGNTPLMSAAGANQRETVAWLLAEGASTQVRNQNKKTALDIARQLGHENVVAELETADAKRGVMSIFR